MSKYDVQYQSESKGLVDIETMATPHLANAWRKLGGATLEADWSSTLPVRAAMFDEMVSRGCVYDHVTEKWTFPAKSEATP